MQNWHWRNGRVNGFVIMIEQEEPSFSLSLFLFLCHFRREGQNILRL